jgi:hypothetical protein
MKAIWLGAVVLVVTIPVISFIGFGIRRSVTADEGYQELANGAIWGDLQVFEAGHRSDHLSPPLVASGIFDGRRRDVLGLASGDPSSPYLWVLLQGSPGPARAYVMPNIEGVPVHCAYINKIESDFSIDSDVKLYLHNRCT